MLENYHKKGVRQIAVTTHATLVLDFDGFVFCWGDGTYGETGKFKNMRKGKCVDFDEPILSISGINLIILNFFSFGF